MIPLHYCKLCKNKESCRSDMTFKRIYVLNSMCITTIIMCNTCNISIA